MSITVYSPKPDNQQTVTMSETEEKIESPTNRTSKSSPFFGNMSQILNWKPSNKKPALRKLGVCEAEAANGFFEMAQDSIIEVQTSIIFFMALLGCQVGS